MTIEEMNQIVIWTAEAKVREQIIMLRILSIYGSEPFTATYQELAREIGFKRSMIIASMRGIKELGWIESEWVYEKNGRNLPTVKHCRYTVTIQKEPSAVPPTEG